MINPFDLLSDFLKSEFAEKYGLSWLGLTAGAVVTAVVMTVVVMKHLYLPLRKRKQDTAEQRLKDLREEHEALQAKYDRLAAAYREHKSCAYIELARQEPGDDPALDRFVRDEKIHKG